VTQLSVLVSDTSRAARKARDSVSGSRSNRFVAWLGINLKSNESSMSVLYSSTKILVDFRRCWEVRTSVSLLSFASKWAANTSSLDLAWE
jgi:hypothetical protein